jgi:hypothetical protein
MVKVPPFISSTQRAFLGLLAEGGDRLLDFGEAHLVGIADDGDDQALGRGDATETSR